MLYRLILHSKSRGGARKTSRESRKTALRTYYRLSKCHIVFTKICQYTYYCHYYYYHNLSFWVLSQFDFLCFVTIWVFKFCRSLSFQILSEVVFFIFFKIQIFEFCHNLIFWVLSQFEFLSCHNLSLSFVKNLVFEFCHNLSFLVLSQFEFCHNLSFVTIWVWVLSQFQFFFVFCHSFRVLSQFEFWSLVTFFFSNFFYCCHNLCFRFFVTIGVLDFCHNWSFKFCNNFNFWVLSQF